MAEQRSACRPCAISADGRARPRLTQLRLAWPSRRARSSRTPLNASGSVEHQPVQPEPRPPSGLLKSTWCRSRTRKGGLSALSRRSRSRAAVVRSTPARRDELSPRSGPQRERRKHPGELRASSISRDASPSSNAQLDRIEPDRQRPPQLDTPKHGRDIEGDSVGEFAA